MRKSLLLLVMLVCACVAYGQEVTEGSLYASSKGKELGACPLKTTVVRADISGFLARVTVKQEFENSFTQPIEAVYVFPLSHKGTVR
jgi:Ca-activated chloride channel homolog